jgi:OOP family OmpA-OmpF porin
MKTKLIAAAAALFLCAGAQAQGYASVSVGQARLNLDCSGATTCDKSDTAFKLIGGYKFAPNFGAELGYFHFGKAKAAGGGISGEVTNTAFGGGVAFMQDLAPNWNFVGRLGLAQVKTKISGTVAGVGSASDSDNNIALYGGLGVGYKIAPNVSLDAAWDFTKSKYDKNGADFSANINVLSVGLTFSF